MKPVDIYESYLIPKNLQEHMLRVAGLASTIVENWQGEDIDGESIVQACLFHDIAKPMTFEVEKQVEFGMNPDYIEQLKSLQKRLKADYGEDEHKASVQICKEIGCSDLAVELLDNLEWDYLPRLLKENNIESMIPIYCDMRIGPEGLLSLRQRIDELEKRVGGDGYEAFWENGGLVEALIDESTSISLKSISNDEVEERAKQLLEEERL